MNADPGKDVRFWRLALLMVGLLALGLAVWVVVDGTGGTWRGHQTDFYARIGAKQARVEVRQIRACTGEVDRCVSCHLGGERDELRDPKVPHPHRAHPSDMLHHQHKAQRIACSACHGGSGRALREVEAHAMPGGTEIDPLMKQPHIQASCARCHLPGAVKPAERLLAGARLYAELGCAVCHPLGAGGRGGFDYGPDLRTIGRKSLAYLKTSLSDPLANFADSTMPAFGRTFEENPEAEIDLLIFLESLVLTRPADCSQRDRSDYMLGQACASCHAGSGGKASGRFEHRCSFVLARKDELRCANCHPQEIPKATRLGGGFCPRIQQERNRCSLCHEGR